MSLTKVELEKMIEELFFNQPKADTLVMYTGHGGCKDTVHAYMKELKLESTWRNFRRIYLFLIRTGAVIRRGSAYQISA